MCFILAAFLATASADESDLRPVELVDTHMHLFPGRSASATPGTPPSSRHPFARSGSPYASAPGRPAPRARPSAASADGDGGSDLDFGGAAKALVDLMDRHGVAKALVMPPPQNPGQTGAYTYAELSPALAPYRDRLLLVAGGGTLNPMIQGVDSAAVTASLKQEFRARAAEIVRAGARAFGEMTAMHVCMSSTHHFVAAPPDHPLFLELADLAAEHGLPIDLHMEAVPAEMPTPQGLLNACDDNPRNLPATIPGFERLLAHNRGAKIVWQHIGWDNVGTMTPELVGGLLARHPNLYIAIRVEEIKPIPSRGDHANRITDEREEVRPEWRALFEKFPDRVMVGGDEFVGGTSNQAFQPKSFELTWSAVKSLPPALRNAIGGGNAARVYRLD